MATFARIPFAQMERHWRVCEACQRPTITATSDESDDGVWITWACRSCGWQVAGWEGETFELPGVGWRGED